MVAKAGGYYRTVLQGSRGVMQVDTLSPAIFNVVVNAVVRNRLMVVIAGEEERGECGQEGRHQAALFYADYCMVALSDPCCIQGVFNTLVGLFDRVGL